jgi:hypothetical protein
VDDVDPARAAKLLDHRLFVKPNSASGARFSASTSFNCRLCTRAQMSMFWRVRLEYEMSL